MTNIVNLPTYEQSEEIKSELENMLEKIIENSGTDFSKYEPFSIQNPINIPVGDLNYKTGLSLEGKGYLSAAVLRGDIGGNAVKITIDGKVVLETSAVVPSHLTGFLMREYTNANSSNQLTFSFSNNSFVMSELLAMFIPTLQINSAFLSSQFLFFEKSLLVEFRRIGTTVGGSINNLISGGKMK